MYWVVLLTALATVAVVTGLATLLKLDRPVIVEPMAFGASLGTTFTVGGLLAGPGLLDELIIASVALSAVTVAAFATARYYMDPFDARHPSPSPSH
jgi:hypothetical protein